MLQQTLSDGMSMVVNDAKRLIPTHTTRISGVAALVKLLGLAPTWRYTSDTSLRGCVC